MRRPRFLLLLSVALAVTVEMTAALAYVPGRGPGDGRRQFLIQALPPPLLPPPAIADAAAVRPATAGEPVARASVSSSRDDVSDVLDVNTLYPWQRQAEEPRARQQGNGERVSRGSGAAAASTADTSGIAAEAQRRWGAGQLLLAIPRLGVTAPIGGLGFEADGKTLASPGGPWGVGWYQFTAYPGTGGNAVLSGHVDWYTGAPAVFGGLRALGPGDAVYIVLPNGTALAYAVASAQLVRPNSPDVPGIIGRTDREAITMIACAGAWDPVAKDYSHRLVVRAYRIR